MQELAHERGERHTWELTIMKPMSNVLRMRTDLVRDGLVLIPKSAVIPDDTVI
jgi:hypothetical protein